VFARYTRRSLAVAILLVVATLGTVGAVNASTAGQPYCGITWGSLPKANDVLYSAALVDARTGQHACYDRVVFEFNNTAAGYRVNYADQVYSEGKGQPLSPAGGARLSVVLFENVYDVDTGIVTYPHSVGDHVANVSGYRTLRDLVYGGTFEGNTTMGLGVRARLPFRVFTLAGPGAHTRIVIDVAHQWSQ
jgi:hypothetical protein